ncbi:MAG: dUTP diphosphatase [Coprobacillaceae bacterium]
MSKVNELYQKHVNYELQTLNEEKKEILNTEKIRQKVLAFLSEVGKVSEESRCFSFWDTSTSDTKELLEYYVDGLQLLLSIGFELQVENIKQYSEIPPTLSLTEQFLKIYDEMLKIQKHYHFEDYQNAIDDYFTLGFLLGFDIDTITDAYKKHI